MSSLMRLPLHTSCTVRDVLGFDASLAGLVIPATMKLPVALKLWAAGLVGQRVFNLMPRHSAMLLHIVVSNSVRNALVTQHHHKPVEQCSSVALFDCRPN